MPLSVKDGMGAWIKDFQKSDAPQFKGKSDKERREMAMAAYLSAKRGDKNEATDKPPFTPDPPRPKAKNSDATVTSPMSRAKQLAKMARDRGLKKEDVELDEAKDMYKSAAGELKDYANKSGGMDKKDFHTAAKHIENIGRANLMNKGQHLAQLSKHLRNLDTSPREKVLSVLNKHGHNVGDFMPGAKMRRESVQLDELSPATHKSYQAKAFKSGAAGMAAKRMGTMSAKDAYDNEKKRHAGIELSKSLQRRDDRKKRNAKEVEENVSAPQSAAHRRAQMGSRYSDFGTQAQRMMSPLQKIRQDKEKADRDKDGKLKKEETVSELKKSTLGSYVNKAAKDAASKAYGAASAAKDNRADQSGKDFSKSLKRLRGIDTATKKLAKEDIDEAKSFDQKFKDHLKFMNSKSKAVQDYMAKRKANRDTAHAKQDPSAVKKNYGPAVIPPGTAYNKARKRMDPSAAANAVSNTFKNRAKGRKLPEGKIEEAVQFQVDVEGLPPTFMTGRSSAEILAKLRKIVKQPSMIKGVERKTETDVKKVYRQKAQGREVDEAIDPTDTGGKEEASMAMRQIKAMDHFLDGIEDRVKATGDMEEWYQNKLTKAHDYLKTLYAYGKGDNDEDEMDEKT